MAAGQSDPPLLSAKLTPPAPPRAVVPRDALVARVSPSALPAITLVEGPAGFGKTTTVAQWATGARNVAWVSLDPADGDPARFWAYVLEALAPHLGRDGERAQNALRSGADVRDGVLPWLANGIGDRAVHLVLDDYHAVGSSEVHEQVGYLAGRMPAGLHLVFVTRADPPLPLARMRAGGALLREIGPDDLRFTHAEAATLINGRHELGLPADDLERLVDRTEGWPAGLALAALTLTDAEDRRGLLGSLAGPPADVRDFLVLEVLEQVSPQARELLVKCSVLDRWSGPLCDAVVGHGGSATILRDLRRANAFVAPFDASDEWYRLHQLFRDALRRELEFEGPGEIEELNRRAAGWYRDAGMYSDAIEHAIEAGENGMAADLIAAVFLAEFAEGRGSTVERWLKALPRELVETDARLALAGACLASVVGHHDEVEKWLELAERGEERRPLPAALPSMEAGIAIVRGSHSGGNVGRQLDAARAGVRLCADESSPWHAYAVGALGFALYWAGDAHEARSVIREAQQAMNSPLPAAVLLAYDAFVALDLGDWRLGDRLARQAAGMLAENNFEQAPRACVVRVAQGRAHIARGEMPAAVTQLGEAVALARRGPYLVETIDALLWLAHAQMSAGVTEAGEDHLREGRRLLERCVDPGVLRDRSRRLGRVARDGTQAAEPEDLSRRELEVLRLLQSPLSESEIGARLFISHNTVHSHTKAIFRKLRVSSRAQAVERARAVGLLDGQDGAEGRTAATL
jgi:LuxR family transcriptional regulator, maltose regulon positive regulatory protein